MSQSEVDRLLDQLMSEDVRDRRNAVNRLGELGQPEAIAELVNTYQKDPDASVRAAAANALVQFRRIEQKMLGIETDDEDDEDGAPIRAGMDLNPLLMRGRLLLAITLGITLLINAVLFIGNALPKPTIPTPTVANVLTPRNELVANFQSRITAARTEAATLRQLFSGIQGLGLIGVNQDQCKALALSGVNAAPLAPINANTYPDLPKVNDLINTPVQKLFSIRTNYLLLCSIKDKAQFDTTIKGQGGAAQMVATIDEATNKELPAAEAALKVAIDSPAATVAPTATPTLAPTNTPAPTGTPTKAPTAGPKPASSKAPDQPTEGAAVTQAEAPKSLTIIDLGLPDLDSYRYRVTGKSSGTLANNKIFNGSMTVNVKRQLSPLLLQIDMSISEGIPALRFFESIGPLYVQGESSFVVIDNVLYETGDVLPTTKFNGRCRASRLTGDLNARLIDFSPKIDALTFDLTESGVDVNGTAANHYHAEQVAGNSNDTLQKIDLYLAATNNIPLKLTILTTLNPKLDAKALAATGLKDLNVTITYELLEQNPAVKIVKPIICEGVDIR
jgi:hypothetical protein